MNQNAIVLAQKIIQGQVISKDESSVLSDVKQVDIWDLMHGANRIREHFFGKRIKFCSIINAQSGACSEDCRFCAQSAHYPTSAEIYPLVDPEEIKNAAQKARDKGAAGFSIVMSGKGVVEGKDFSILQETVAGLRDEKSYLCASLGALDIVRARQLKESGLKRYHHNLETAGSFFSEICTTHSYEDKLRTIRKVKNAGLEVCSGGIFGLGESWEQRIEMAFTLRELAVDSIPINFLNPVKGTPLGTRPLLSPLEALRIISVYRFIFPDKDITVCGGRERTLRDMQSYMFYAGANGAMLGNYLTTQGRPADEDRQMVKDLGLRWE